MLNNVMANSQVFFNSRLDFADLEPTPMITDNLKRITGLFISLGDRCLTPVRYFGNGSVIAISTDIAGHFSVEEEKEFEKSSMIGMALRVLCYAITIIPGVIVGTLLKGIGYAISSHVRAAVHGAAFLQYAPSVSECGSKASPIDFTDDVSINNAATATKAKNSYNCPTDTLIVYAKGDVTHANLRKLLHALEPNQIKYFVVVSDTLSGRTDNSWRTIDAGLQVLLTKRGLDDKKK